MDAQTPQTFSDYARAFGPLVAAFVAVGVGAMQYYLQSRKYKQDMYDKRFRVYEGTANFVATVLRADGKFEMSEYRQFRIDTDPVEFLFKADVTAFVIDIGKSSLWLKSLHEQIKHHEITTSVRVTGTNQAGIDRRYNEAVEKIPLLQNEVHEIETKLAKAFEGGVKEMFRPYLQLHFSESLPERLFALIDRMDSGMQKLMRSRYET